VNKFINQKCPTCNKSYTETNLNLALLALIPESEYDKLKIESLKACIEINEAKQNLKHNRQETLNSHETKLTTIKRSISAEASQLITIVKQNEKRLTDECDFILNEIKSDFNSYKFEDNILFQIDELKNKIERDGALNEAKLSNLSKKIFKIKNQLNEMLDQVKKYENKYDFVKSKFISSDALAIGELKTVFI